MFQWLGTNVQLPAESTISHINVERIHITAVQLGHSAVYHSPQTDCDQVSLACLTIM